MSCAAEIQTENSALRAQSIDREPAGGQLSRNGPRTISIIIEIGLDVALCHDHVISMKVEQAAKQLEALGNSTRLRVYRALVRAGEAGLPVGRLQQKLGIAASTLSHHLHRLIMTELVTQERQGTTL